MKIFPTSQNLVGIAFHLTQAVKKLLLLFVLPNPEIPAFHRPLQLSVEVRSVLKNMPNARTFFEDRFGVASQLKRVFCNCVDSDWPLAV